MYLYKINMSYIQFQYNIIIIIIMIIEHFFFYKIILTLKKIYLLSVNILYYITVDFLSDIINT